MGYTVVDNTTNWRYVLWCRWTAQERANFSACEQPELYDHRGQEGVLFDPNLEYLNVVDKFPSVAAWMDTLLRRVFGGA